MRTRFKLIAMVCAATTAGLMAGLFYAYTVSVVPGLKQLPDLQYLTAMQSINRAILNPVFFMGFLGALVLLPMCTYLNFTRPPSAEFSLLVCATILYVVGVMAVTMFGNVPLNDALDKLTLSSSTSHDLAAQRAFFENKWNNLNMIRTVASFFSFLFVLIAVIKK